MGYYVYILRSLKDGGLYTGSSGDLVRRYAEHCRGNVASTRWRRPLELVYVEECGSRCAALARERQLKSLEGGAKKFRLVAAQDDRVITILRSLYIREAPIG